ncbi:hypothetical protein [Paenibacillus sp. y28]
MTGRNSKPENRGPAAKPSRIEQFGESLAGASNGKPLPDEEAGREK